MGLSRLLRILLTTSVGLVLVGSVQAQTLSFTQSELDVGSPWPTYSVAGDFNHDGKPDIAAANGRPGIGILLGNGDGTYAAPTTYEVTDECFGITIGDFDRNGTEDLAVACVREWGSGSGGTYVSKGNGDGTFQPFTRYLTPAFTQWIASGDFNRDGMVDLASLSCIPWANEKGVVAVLLNDGTGNFPTQSLYVASAPAHSINVGKFNGDNFDDIVVSEELGTLYGFVELLLNDETGAFPTKSQIALESPGAWVTSGDVNNDGLVDLAVALRGIYAGVAPGIQVLLGAGTGIFTAGDKVPSSFPVSSSVIADFDLDGNLDLAEPLRLAFGNGDGTFQAPQDIVPGGVYGQISVADLDVDGRADILAGNFIYLNRMPPRYKAYVQQPIDPDGGSVFSAKRGVIPTKFTLTQNNLPTCNLPPATIAVTRTSGSVLGMIDESAFVAAADAGINFRIDETTCQYIYNLSSKNLGVGAYLVEIKVNGQVIGSAVFGLK